MDRVFIVKWREGSVAVHASSEKEAKNVAVEYIQSSGEILQAELNEKPVPMPSFSPVAD